MARLLKKIAVEAIAPVQTGVPTYSWSHQGSAEEVILPAMPEADTPEAETPDTSHTNYGEIRNPQDSVSPLERGALATTEGRGYSYLNATVPIAVQQEETVPEQKTPLEKSIESFKSQRLSPTSPDYIKLHEKFGWDEIRLTTNFTACRSAGVPAWFKGRKAYLWYNEVENSDGYFQRVCVGSFFPATKEEFAKGKTNTWSINGVWSGIEYINSDELGDI